MPFDRIEDAIQDIIIRSKVRAPVLRDSTLSRARLLEWNARIPAGDRFVLTGRTLLTLLPTQTEAARSESERALTRFARLCETRLASR